MSGVDKASVVGATHDNSPIYISDDKKVKLWLNLVTHKPYQVDGYPFLLSLSYLGVTFQSMCLDRTAASKLLRADNPLVPLEELATGHTLNTATVMLNSINDRAFLRKRLHDDCLSLTI